MGESALAAPALAAVAGLVALAACLRFYGIGHQGFWFDEANTAQLVRFTPGRMLGLLPGSESTPPLYYCVAWVWARLWGDGEAGLRSLSAVFGVAAVPVAYAAARALWDERAGLVAALLIAVNPYLVWYSQEARSYSLLVLLCLTTVWLLATKRYAWWAVAAVAALCTHYFAIFVLLPEGLWLRRWKPILPVGAAALALLPLALHQRASGSTAFIGDISLWSRIVDLPKKFVTGELDRLAKKKK